MKNTMGYGLNSLLDFHSPMEMLAHFAIGSEGTLGFIAEAVFRTVPKPTPTATGLLVFPDLDAASGTKDLSGGSVFSRLRRVHVWPGKRWQRCARAGSADQFRTSRSAGRS